MLYRGSSVRLIEPLGTNEYLVLMVAKVGPVSAKFRGKLALSDMQPPDSYALAFEGQGGPAGFGKGSARVRLAADPGGARLSYDVKASVGGKLAQIGSRLVDAAAKKVADDFFRNFTLRLSPEGAEEDTIVPAGRIKPRGKAAARAGEVAPEPAPTLSDTSVMIFAAVALIVVLLGLILFLR